MAERKRRRSSARFALGMVIYALTFLLFTAIGLRFLWLYLDNRERSEPVHTIDRYLASFDSNHIRALSADFVSSLDHRLESEEQSFQIIEKLFDGNLRYAIKNAETTDTHLVYAILDGKRLLGTVTLDATGEKGDNAWAVTGESFEFTDLLRSNDILVPAEWQVSFNDNLLDESYITERGIEYPSMAEAYDYGFALPTLVRYHVENYIGELSFAAADADGNPAQAQEDPAAYTLGDRCTADERERIEDYTRRLLPLYIAFMSNTNHNAYDNYARIHPYLLPGSDLESRFYSAIAGQTYSHSQGDYLHDVVVNGVFSLGGSQFLVDVDYQVDTTGNAGTITDSAGMLIVVEDQQARGIFASEIFIK